VRFFLDQNVDARVATVLRDMGHEAWTAEESGLSREADPNLTIYAHDRDAALLTHDREFSQTFKKHIVGRHVYLDCREPAAREVVASRLPDVIEILERKPDLYVVLRRDSFQVIYADGSTW
jgi:predicted nuclease of predicted toxin-antitoxin system